MKEIRPEQLSRTATSAQLRNCAAWNADKAIDAYHDGRLNDYGRLILQADRLWSLAAATDLLGALGQK